MPDEIKSNQAPIYDKTGINCPQCDASLPNALFMRYIKANFIRYFIFAFCLSFTLLTIIVDLRLHWSDSKDPSTIPFNPYKVAVIISGIISLIGWLSQKQNDIRKELSAKGASNSNAQS